MSEAVHNLAGWTTWATGMSRLRYSKEQVDLIDFGDGADMPPSATKFSSTSVDAKTKNCDSVCADIAPASDDGESPVEGGVDGEIVVANIS